MTRIVVNSKVGSDGVLHLDLPVGSAHADKNVQVTVEPAGTASKSATISAADLLKSGLAGMWADRADIGDSQDYARRLREQAQTRRRNA